MIFSEKYYFNKRYKFSSKNLLKLLIIGNGVYIYTRIGGDHKPHAIIRKGHCVVSSIEAGTAEPSS